jgi:MSHA pilin protein MshD
MSIKPPEIARARRRQHGLTMVELIMFIVIVSVAITGVLGILTYTTQHSGDPQMRKQALAIAEGLLEEVQTARFTYCDPADANAETATGAFVDGAAVGVGCAAAVENVGLANPADIRPYNNVADYVAAFYDSQPAFDSADLARGDATVMLRDANLTPIVATGQYTARLTITPENLNGIVSTSAPATMEVLRLTVQVTYNGGEVTLDGYRTRYAPNSIP